MNVLVYVTRIVEKEWIVVGMRVTGDSEGKERMGVMSLVRKHRYES